MGSGKTRKLSIRDEDLDHENLPESSTEPRTRPRLEFEPLGFGIQQQPMNTNQDARELTLFVCVQDKPQPPPELPQPQPIIEHQDSSSETELGMHFLVNEPSQKLPQQPPQQPKLPEVNNADQKPKLTMYFYVQEEQPQPQPQLIPDNPITVPQQQPQQMAQSVIARVPRGRKKPTNLPGQGKSTTIQPPFPWATDRRAQVHGLKYLIDNGMKTISGDMECKRCQKVYQIEYNLEEKFAEIADYIAKNKYDLRHRAPQVWTNPVLPKCNICHQEKGVKPVINKKKLINWLFLLLGQMLGCCTLGQLKYFCKHTGNHRTGAKDRVLFLTYLGLCKQVNPDGPFDLHE